MDVQSKGIALLINAKNVGDCTAVVSAVISSLEVKLLKYFLNRIVFSFESQVYIQKLLKFMSAKVVHIQILVKTHVVWLTCRLSLIFVCCVNLNF